VIFIDVAMKNPKITAFSLLVTTLSRMPAESDALFVIL